MIVVGNRANSRVVREAFQNIGFRGFGDNSGGGGGIPTGNGFNFGFSDGFGNDIPPDLAGFDAGFNEGFNIAE